MRRVRVWSAGCACGEEVYSLKILWDRMNRSAGTLPALDITATDLNPLHLERSEAAVFSTSSLREVPEETRSTCFAVEGGKRFNVADRGRSLLCYFTWQIGDAACFVISYQST